MPRTSNPARLVAAALICLLTAAALALSTPAAHAAAPSACPAVAASAASVSSRTVDAAVRCLVNAQRAARGLKPLRGSGRLVRAATAHSRDMVTRGFFDHVTPGGRTLADRARRAGYRGVTLGEDIGWGTESLATPAGIVDQWMHSPPHRAVILSRRFNEVGIGVAVGTPVDRSPVGAVYTLDAGRG